MRRLLYIALVAAAWGCLLSECAVFTACKRQPVAADPTPVKVKVQRVNSQSGLRNAGYVGSVSPVRTVVLNTHFPGTLEKVYVKQGQIVEKGDLLAEVHSSLVVSHYEMSKANLQQAEDAYKRVMQVYDKGSIPEIKKVEVESLLKKAQSAFASAESSMESCRLKAPFRGIVSEVYGDEGVEINMLAPIVRLTDISDVDIKIQIPEKEINKIAVGDTAWFAVAALGDEIFPALVQTKGILAAPLSHSYECGLKPLGETGQLLPGMVCKVYLKSELRRGIVVSSSVVQMDAEGKYVWLVDGNRTVEKRYITVGGYYANGVVVTEGLEEGDALVSEGGYKICSGMKVAVEEE